MDPIERPANELPGIGFLADVSSEHRGFLACFGRFLRPQSGDVLIKEGEAQDSLYLILSGTLHVMAEVDGRQILLASFGQGESLGEVNLFDPATASATAIMRSPGVVWVLSRAELGTFLDSDPQAGVEVSKGLLKMLAHRIRSMNEKLASSEHRASMHNFWTSNPQ